MKLFPLRIVTLAFVIPVLAAGVPGEASAEPLSLAACEQLALRANLDAAQAQGALSSAEADVTSARAAFLPSVAVSGTISKPEDRIEVFQGGELKFFDKTYSADAQARMTLFDGGANWSNYRAATRSREAAEDRLLSARQRVLYETAARYYGVARSQELMEVAKKASELSDEQLKKTRAMKDLGAATQADVYKAEVDRSNARLEEIRAERDLRVAIASLADFIGRSMGEKVEIMPLDPETPVPFDLAEARDRALDNNPTLRASELSRDAQKLRVSSAKADRYPSLSVWGSNSFYNFEFADFDDEHNDWRIGASLNFTVFDGLITKANIRRAQSNLQVSEKALESTRNSVLFVVEQTYLDLDVAREAITVAEGGVRSSEEDLRLAQERFKIGEGTILDVIDAQVNLRRARSTLVGARYDARLARAALLNAIGDVEVPDSP